MNKYAIFQIHVTIHKLLPLHPLVYILCLHIFFVFREGGGEKCHVCFRQQSVCGVMYAIHDGQFSGATYADTYSAPKEVTWCSKIFQS